MSGISYDERVMGKEFDSKTFSKHGSLCQSLSGDESSRGVATIHLLTKRVDLNISLVVRCD